MAVQTLARPPHLLTGTPQLEQVAPIATETAAAPSKGTSMLPPSAKRVTCGGPSGQAVVQGGRPLVPKEGCHLQHFLGLPWEALWLSQNASQRR